MDGVRRKTTWNARDGYPWEAALEDGRLTFCDEDSTVAVSEGGKPKDCVDSLIAFLQVVREDLDSGEGVA